MSLAIDYDRPVKDYIADLSRTGHVTHSSHKKTSVTLHHNAGVNISHAGILGIWKSRPASAHFDVDKSGNVAQFVKVDEYAWAVGDASGNSSSISIEMANSHGASTWDVSETTWKAAARLAGWLFAHVIKAKPTKSNLLPHHHWSSTACPGPFVDKHFAEILKEVVSAYNEFTGDKPATGGTSSGKKKTVPEIASEVIAGKWGNGDDRVRRLRAASYDPNAIQTEVNRQMHAGTTATPKKSITEIAREVIAGKWSNGDDRKSRLKKAGYDYNKIQAEVNRLLK